MKRTENAAVASMRAGFTLMEILVAVAIIGILGTVAVQTISGHIEKTRITAAKSSVDSIRQACETYNRDHMKYPTDLKQLITAKNGEDPLIEGGEAALDDPWGNAYKYEKNGKRIVIISAGPDGDFGNEDDLRSDTMQKRNKD